MTREAGFSLLEVLAAAAVFALISALSAGLLAGALRTQDQSQAVLSELSDVHRIASLLRDDVGQIANRPVRTPDGLDDPRVFAVDINGTQDIRGRTGEALEILVLTRSGWANPGLLQPRSSLQRVSWELEEDRLYRTIWAYPDPVSLAEPRRQLLADGVSNVQIEVLAEGRWSNQARIAPAERGGLTLPDAVRLRYEMAGFGPLEHVVLTPAVEARS